jgi:parallel beta-helix repeat protein
MIKQLYRFTAICAAAVYGHAQNGLERPVTFSSVIDEPGRYYLVSDLSVGNATPGITIRANNVVLDLRGRQIGGPGTNTGTGILINGASSVEVRNGSMRDLGFGVTVMNSDSVVLDGLRITARGLAVPAPPPEVGIMIVNSKGVTVRHNTIFSVGLGIFVRGPGSMGNHIYENTISAGMNGMLGICYNPAPGASGGPRGDTVARNAVSGFATAIQVNAGGPNIFRDNTLSYTMQAFEVTMGSVATDTGNTKVQVQ